MYFTQKLSGQIEFKVVANDGDLSDNFGYSVAISGDYATVGAYFDDDNGSNSGSAYIFFNNDTSWIEQAKLIPDDGEEDDYFGYSTAISGNYAVVGAYHDDDNGSKSGSAYVFFRSGTTWNQQTKLLPADGSANDYFGGFVDISGDYIVVGAHEHDSNDMLNTGTAYIFYRTGTNWNEQAQLFSSDMQTNDYFGNSVSISGDYAIIGALNDDDNGSNSGSAYIFYRNGTDWIEQSKLTAIDGEKNDYFGCSVDISGDYSIVGASGKDVNGEIDAGTAYIFYHGEANWEQQAKLVTYDFASKDFLGNSLTLFGEYAVVGAYYDDDKGSNSGSTYIFQRNGINWPLHAKIVASDGTWMDHFGYSVDIDRDNIIVGGYGDEENTGSAYFYKAKAYIEEKPAELPPPPPPEPEPIPLITLIKFVIGFILYAVMIRLTWFF